MIDAETTRAQVLVVDDRENVLELMARVLGEAHEVTTTADPLRAMELLADGRFDVLLTDVCMPEADGFELLAAARRCAAPPRVVMITGFASIPDAVAAMRQGAFDYLPKPLEAEEIALVVARALEQRGADPAAGPGHAAAAADGEAVVETLFHEAIASARDRASRDYLVALMRQFHGNVTHAATRAGITRESLHRLLKKYGVRSEGFRSLAH
jgi:DNA-binding NtrC family response regulator